jgi:hypothetical protein
VSVRTSGWSGTRARITASPSQGGRAFDKTHAERHWERLHALFDPTQCGREAAQAAQAAPSPL